MESAGKQGMSWQTSSEENNEVNQENDSQATKTTGKRSYECTYCKRGFTNAQALGGHMNIHRKDRAAKAKQHTHNYRKDPNEDSSRFSSSADWYHPIDYNRSVHFQPSSGPSIATTFSYETPNQSASRYELGSADLGLQVGDEARPGSINGEGLDLELRLGHRYK